MPDDNAGLAGAMPGGGAVMARSATLAGFSRLFEITFGTFFGRSGQSGSVISVMHFLDLSSNFTTICWISHLSIWSGSDSLVGLLSGYRTPSPELFPVRLACSWMRWNGALLVVLGRKMFSFIQDIFCRGKLSRAVQHVTGGSFILVYCHFWITTKIDHIFFCRESRRRRGEERTR